MKNLLKQPAANVNGCTDYNEQERNAIEVQQLFNQNYATIVRNRRLQTRENWALIADLYKIVKESKAALGWPMPCLTNLDKKLAKLGLA